MRAECCRCIHIFVSRVHFGTFLINFQNSCDERVQFFAIGTPTFSPHQKCINFTFYLQQNGFRSAAKTHTSDTTSQARFLQHEGKKKGAVKKAEAEGCKFGLSVDAGR